MLVLLFTLVSGIAVQPAWAEDLTTTDTTQAITAPAPQKAPVIRKGLTAIEDPEQPAAPVDTQTVVPTKDLSKLDSIKTSDTTNLLGAHKSTIDSIRFSVFAQTGISFLGFDDRTRFAEALDTLYIDYLSDALNSKDSARVKKQNYQNVNFCFPIYGGLDFRLSQVHHIAIGAGYIYDRESVIITDRNSDPHEIFYVLQAVPLFVEWKIGISPRLISLDERQRFSATLRYWWLLSGTEIYSNWGAAKAKSDKAGQGWGFALGYQLLEWKRVRIFGDLGFSILKVSSDDPWSAVVPDYSEEGAGKAKWELGGIQLNLRASLGLLKD